MDLSLNLSFQLYLLTLGSEPRFHYLQRVGQLQFIYVFSTEGQLLFSSTCWGHGDLMGLWGQRAP